MQKFLGIMFLSLFYSGCRCDACNAHPLSFFQLPKPHKSALHFHWLHFAACGCSIVFITSKQYGDINGQKYTNNLHFNSGCAAGKNNCQQKMSQEKWFSRFLVLTRVSFGLRCFEFIASKNCHLFSF